MQVSPFGKCYRDGTEPDDPVWLMARPRGTGRKRFVLWDLVEASYSSWRR